MSIENMLETISHEQLSFLQSRLRAKPQRRQSTTRSSSSRVAKHSMALPRHPPGVDSQMPAMRRSVCRVVHRHRRFRLNRSMDPDSNADVLLDLAGISCCQILAQAFQGARISSFSLIMIASGSEAGLRVSPDRDGSRLSFRRVFRKSWSGGARATSRTDRFPAAATWRPSRRS